MNSELQFTPPEPLTSYERRKAAFERFHRENPLIYSELVRRARQAKACGARKLGLRMLVEVLRWDLMVRTVRLEGEPKINDAFTPFYSRLIQERESDLAGFFEVRTRGDGE